MLFQDYQYKNDSTLVLVLVMMITFSFALVLWLCRRQILISKRLKYEMSDVRNVAMSESYLGTRQPFEDQMEKQISIEDRL